MNDRQREGFFHGLFDFSFSTFITTSIIRFLFALGVVVLIIGAVILLLMTLSQGLPAFIAALIIVPVVFLLYAILLRISCEMTIVIFRGVEYLRIIAEKENNQSPPSHGPGIEGPS